MLQHSFLKNEMNQGQPIVYPTLFIIIFFFFRLIYLLLIKKSQITKEIIAEPTIHHSLLAINQSL